MKLIFIHAAGPQGVNEGSTNLLQFLKQNLGESMEIIAPEMPTPEDPNAADWMDTLDAAIHKVDERIILMGHSLGASIIFKYLSERKCENGICGIISLAAPYWGLSDWQSEQFTISCYLKETINPSIPIRLYHDFADDMVPYQHVNTYATALPQAELIGVTGQGHLFENGFPELVKVIRSLSTQNIKTIINP
ncbi:alpha/beta hydrolase [Roseivirga pacifica]